MKRSGPQPSGFLADKNSRQDWRSIPALKQLTFLVILLSLFSCSSIQEPAPRASDTSQTHIPQTWGPLEYEEGGYTFFAPMNSQEMFLLNASNEIVYTWTGVDPHFLTGELMPDGSVLRHLIADNMDPLFDNFGGSAGKIQILGPDNRIQWEWVYSDENKISHHALELMPNGNILLIGWERISAATAIANGLDTNVFTYPWICPTILVEVEPVGSNQANIVWKWRAWDHIVQEHNSAASNYTVVTDNPQLIHLNFFDLSKTNSERMMDWLHVNSVDYNADLDVIVIGSLKFSELWMIDHSTTTAESAGHSGGNYGRGGDLLARWGNPQASGHGEHAHRQLFRQHDVHWIPQGLPGAGNLLIFNNGGQRTEDNNPDSNYTSILEISLTSSNLLPYHVTASNNNLTASVIWEYTDPVDKFDFWSRNISGAQRLPDGNTLITAGALKYLFESTPANASVWQYDTVLSVFKAYRYYTNHPGIQSLMQTD